MAKGKKNKKPHTIPVFKTSAELKKVEKEQKNKKKSEK